MRAAYKGVHGFRKQPKGAEDGCGLEAQKLAVVDVVYCACRHCCGSQVHFRFCIIGEFVILGHAVLVAVVEHDARSPARLPVGKARPEYCRSQGSFEHDWFLLSRQKPTTGVFSTRGREDRNEIGEAESNRRAHFSPERQSTTARCAVSDNSYL